MNLDRFAFDQHRLEGLDAQAVQRGRPIQQHRMLANNLFENVPADGFLPFDHLARLLDRCGVLLLLELVVNERLEQLERHLFRQSALMQFQFRTDHDYRSARVIDALAQQVLPKTSLLAFESSTQRLQRPIVDAPQDATTPAVVKQSIDSFLQHALLVADNHFRCAQFHQLLETVVPVNDAPVKIVKIRCGKPSAIKWHQRTQLRRNNGNDIQNHPVRTISRFQEGCRNFKPFRELELLLLRSLLAHAPAQFHGELIDVDHREQLLDRFGAHFRHELAWVIAHQFAITLVGQQLALFQLLYITRVDDDVGLEVEDFLEFTQGNIEEMPNARRQPFEEPDVRTRAGEINMSEALTADLSLGDFDTALVANHAAVLHAFVFSAEAFPISDGPKNPGTEQSVTLRLEGAVIDRFRLGHFAVRPLTDLLRR